MRALRLPTTSIRDGAMAVRDGCVTALPIGRGKRGGVLRVAVAAERIRRAGDQEDSDGESRDPDRSVRCCSLPVSFVLGNARWSAHPLLRLNRGSPPIAPVDPWMQRARLPDSARPRASTGWILVRVALPLNHESTNCARRGQNAGGGRRSVTEAGRRRRFRGCGEGFDPPASGSKGTRAQADGMATAVNGAPRERSAPSSGIHR